MSSKGKPNEPNTESKVSRSGHIWQVCDAEDKPYMLMMHRSGHHVWLREDGSVQIKAVVSHLVMKLAVDFWSIAKAMLKLNLEKVRTLKLHKMRL